MSTIRMYSVSEIEMMQNADGVKYEVLHGLVEDGLLDKEQGDEWAAAHTLLIHAPRWGLFRRLIGKQDTSVEGLRITLVKRKFVEEALSPEGAEG